VSECKGGLGSSKRSVFFFFSGSKKRLQFERTVTVDFVRQGFPFVDLQTNQLTLAPPLSLGLLQWRRGTRLEVYSMLSKPCRHVRKTLSGAPQNGELFIFIVGNYYSEVQTHQILLETRAGMQLPTINTLSRLLVGERRIESSTNVLVPKQRFKRKREATTPPPFSPAACSSCSSVSSFP
jgi:hypothetical protein